MEHRLVIDFRQVERDLLSALERRLNQGLEKALPAVKTRVQAVVDEAIRLSPEYYSLLNFGDLRGELGVEDAPYVLDDIIKTIGDSIQVTPIWVKVSNGQVSGGMRVEVLKADYSDILGLPGASFISERGYQVDWLQWLLLEGGNLVVGEHHFLGVGDLSEVRRHRSGNSLGRTGLGIMVPRGNWSVPEQFQGTSSDNWLTRAMTRVGDQALEIMIEEFRRNL